MTLKSPSEHMMLVFWVDLVVLAVTARLLGALMRRFGQPSVVGELFAGLLLGPSLLGKALPGVEKWLFPGTVGQSGLILVVATVGIVMMLIYTGFETDLALIRKMGRAVALVAGFSVALPLALGLATGKVLPASFVAGHGRGLFVMFIGAALAISSLPVIAKILSEMRLTRRNFGQVILASGMANDVVGWILLGALAGAARSGSFKPAHLGVVVVSMLAVLVGMLTVGQRAVDAILRWARARDGSSAAAFTVTLLIGFGVGALTQWIGVEAVLGAFVAGIALGRSKYQDERVERHLELATMTVFAPVFFATAGLRVDLGALASWSMLGWTLLIIAVASLGKFAGAFIGGKLAGFYFKESLALGIGLNARGALEVVIATVGLQLGVLNTRSYTAVVVMAIVTSVAAPPMLRAVGRRWAGTEEEQRRLELEETHATNVLVEPARMLLPASPSDCALVVAKILDLAWPDSGDATVLALGKDRKQAASAVADVFNRREVTVENVDSDRDPVEAVMEHIQLGFDVVGIGAWAGRGEGPLLSPLSEAILSRSKVPVVVAWDGADGREEAVSGFRRVLVPVVSTVASRAAQEVAFSLAAHSNVEVVIAHIDVERSVPVAASVGARTGGGAARQREQARSSRADGVVYEAADLARRLGVQPQTIVRKGKSRAEAICGLARELDVDLVVLGSELQPVAGETFLGDLVERLVVAVDCSVAVVAIPRAALGVNAEPYPSS
ncbi:MAG TPA: cation:proton antiporter [Mycobacteriales bacterium]|nr:cation:proton antiporter [Mycobacteriales bacterium]